MAPGSGAEVLHQVGDRLLAAEDLAVEEVGAQGTERVVPHEAAGLEHVEDAGVRRIGDGGPFPHQLHVPVEEHGFLVAAPGGRERSVPQLIEQTARLV